MLWDGVNRLLETHYLKKYFDIDAREEKLCHKREIERGKTMISTTILKEVLYQALSTGADFAEVFVENTKENVINMIDSKVQTINDKVISVVWQRGNAI